MKKVLASLASVGILILPLVIFAAELEAPALDIQLLLKDVINWLFYGLLVVAAIFIIMAGYMFVTAQGDPDKTKTARNFVLYAVVGVLVGFAAKGLVLLVGTITGYEVSPNW